MKKIVVVGMMVASCCMHAMEEKGDEESSQSHQRSFSQVEPGWNAAWQERWPGSRVSLDGDFGSPLQVRRHVSLGGSPDQMLSVPSQLTTTAQPQSKLPKSPIPKEVLAAALRKHAEEQKQGRRPLSPGLARSSFPSSLSSAVGSVRSSSPVGFDKDFWAEDSSSSSSARVVIKIEKQRTLWERLAAMSRLFGEQSEEQEKQ